MSPAPDARRRLPSVDALLRTPAAREAASNFGRDVVRLAIREALDQARGLAAREGRVVEGTAIIKIAVRRAAGAFLGVQPVINATGVLLHTGLGRAPLGPAALKAVARTAGRYADLEVERTTGRRGRRTQNAEFVLRAVTGAEDALVVNNNAAGLLLALTALARRREVIVSRGELIEIGGEFRLPDVMAASGAKLVEVGTTNRTRRSDYERAAGPRTALILKVHPSNYQVTGFTEEVAIGPLADLAHRLSVPVVHDLGSGLLKRTTGMPASEPTAAGSLAAGANLVSFSGDKLLGGPQAGILLGRAELVEKLRRHPMARALRVDVMTVVALEATLREHATANLPGIPFWRAASASRRELRARARAVAAGFEGASIVDTEAVAGGGSAPGHTTASAGVRLRVPHPEGIATTLRDGRPPVFCRVEEEAVVFDLRSVAPEEDDDLRRAIRYALSQR
ncbi:MAG: L-seryl-tRNA(Sec) selenium transferase [Actinomycetota bacterium]